jgi:hypothetical protein
MRNTPECGHAIGIRKQSLTVLSMNIDVVLRFEYHMSRPASSSESISKPNLTPSLKDCIESIREPEWQLIQYLRCDHSSLSSSSTSMPKFLRFMASSLSRLCSLLRLRCLSMGFMERSTLARAFATSFSRSSISSRT